MKTVTLYFVLALTAISFAQQPDSTDCKGQLKKAAFLLGEWSGGGWIGLPDEEKEYFDQTYLIQSKLDGAMILMEGSSTFRGKNENEPDTTLKSLRILTWYIQMNRFDLKFFREDGVYEMAEAKFPGRDIMTWNSGNPQLGIIYYTMTLDAENNLVQTGEVLECDGVSRIKIFELVLKKEG